MMVIIKKNISNPLGKASGNKQVGESALWDGPLSQDGRPHAKGNSRNGGIKILQAPVPYNSKPITQCAKGDKGNADY